MTFDRVFRSQLHELLVWRRDVRRFRSDPLPGGTLERLIELACLAPSVGLSQPWRFVIVDDPGRRRAMLEEFKSCNADALKSYTGDLAARYAELKLAGMEEAPGQMAVFADPATGLGHGLGRRTMPETAEYSVVAAVSMMWLAARAEGIGMGWVSLFDPQKLGALLSMPADAEPVAILCLGPVPEFPDRPSLELDGWALGRPLAEFVSENGWGKEPGVSSSQVAR